MDPGQFTPASPGRLTLQDEYWAFVPNPLPPEIPPTWTLATQVERASAALLELAGLARNLPNPRLLADPFLRREAILSTRIEGTQTSMQKMVLFEAESGLDDDHPDEQEVLNYIRALNHGLARIQGTASAGPLPLSLRLMKEMHSELMRGVRGQHKHPGEFRSSQNWIGGTTPSNATYVPPPVPELMPALGALEIYIHSEDQQLPKLVQTALIHYQFEAIHPFLDGNGRLGRLLIVFLLIEFELLEIPLLYLSSYFEKHRDTYMAHLVAISRQGAWDEWLLFFLKGVEQEASDGVTRLHRALYLRDEYRAKARETGRSKLLLDLVEELFALPAISVKQTASLLNRSFVAVQSAVNKLEELGILVETTGQARNRVYLAPGILEVFSTELAR